MSNEGTVGPTTGTVRSTDAPPPRPRGVSRRDRLLQQVIRLQSGARARASASLRPSAR